MWGLNHGKDIQHYLQSQVSSFVHTKASPVSETTAHRHDEDLTMNYLNDNLHVCSMHQQYQSTLLLFQLMHTIIKS